MVVFSAPPANILHTRPIRRVMELSHYRWYVLSALHDCRLFSQRSL